MKVSSRAEQWRAARCAKQAERWAEAAKAYIAINYANSAYHCGALAGHYARLAQAHYDIVAKREGKERG